MTADISQVRREEILSRIPLRRQAAPQEIAAVVTFLASEEAGYITGVVLPVDGGLGMGH
jgi:3-oxoacyl-[acyl-carrier protein] reductase